jgi:hypothetical protein
MDTNGTSASLFDERVAHDYEAWYEYLSPRHFLEAQGKAPLLMVPTQE